MTYVINVLFIVALKSDPIYMAVALKPFHVPTDHVTQLD
jgi:hypothetical protein